MTKKCKKHPAYQAKRDPVAACIPCWEIRAAALRERLATQTDRLARAAALLRKLGTVANAILAYPGADDTDWRAVVYDIDALLAEASDA